MGDVSGRGAFRRRAPGARRQSRRRRRKPRSGRGMRRAGHPRGETGDRRPARCRRRRLCPGLRRRNESMGQTTPSTRPRWSGCSTPRSVRISRRGSSNTSGAASRDPPPSGPGLILPGRGTAPASTGPRSATTPSPSSCAADTTPLQVVAVYRTQRRSWRVMTEHVGALLDEYPGPAEHDATSSRVQATTSPRTTRITSCQSRPPGSSTSCLPPMVSLNSARSARGTSLMPGGPVIIAKSTSSWPDQPASHGRRVRCARLTCLPFFGPTDA